jgi:tRNA-2-methylthio-N6-dimethylallyladenosine synthase
MNVNESAKIKKIFENLGYEIIEDIHQSDIIFLNTCTVREGAATQIFGKIGELKTIKEKRGTIIGITGCFAQEQGNELIKKFPIIDIVMGNQNIGSIPEIINKLNNKNNQKKEHIVCTENENILPDHIDADFGEESGACVAITYGCNNFCTYCIVPYVRGRERSVPMDQILEDVRKYVNKGHREITLLGQNVNSYGNDFKNGDNFAKLLTKICAIEEDFLVRFISPHPRDFTDEVIDVMRKNEKISRSIHLPLQSGSSKILKLMNRGYTKEDYLFLANKIKEKINGASLTTDIIVGFPQETEEDFMDTLDVVKQIRFENSFMFMYSKRNGTRAANMDGQIEDSIKKERLQRLIEVQNQCSLENSQKYINKIVRVLVEGESKKNKKMFTGRTSTNKVVLFEGSKEIEGKFVNVRIGSCKTWTLYGEIV